MCIRDRSTAILIDLNNAGDTDNGTYTNCLECGTCVEHLAHINDNSNWTVSSSPTTGGCSTCMFDVKPECEFDVSCPLIMGGNIECFELGSGPLTQAILTAPPYNMDFSSNNPCGTMVITFSDDVFTGTFCAGSFTVRTVTVFDDLNGNGILDLSLIHI